MNRHMESRGFGHGSVGRVLGCGMGYQDYPLPVACPLGIMFSRLNRTRPT
jgi:hypothetical protein